ncbi:FeS-binding protein [Streptomyces tateyamensis]|uniref:Cytochrome bc1 complex Rieske iron-sulfur subunit n=1 Tax=Streptomyces tateyamensis TaxID=565073 RepID=A0A2V4N3L9_9ACTN|nr:Rieske (2Fe-2S) protein [Streptomyces tateyamensis]PYC73985.1 FeS-binding protein [Streptomyces tateyamensis]
MSESAELPTTSRRTLLCCGAAVLAGGSAVAVAGCSSAGASGGSGSGSTATTPARSTAAVEVGAAADVPVGGGKVFRDQLVVVTQPTAGQYKAFSARCTHAGCIVDQVKDNQIQCPCHGSRFSTGDGAVQDGPAPKPLPSYPVSVENGRLMVQK